MFIADMTLMCDNCKVCALELLYADVC
jgi:hypothetical protein